MTAAERKAIRRYYKQEAANKRKREMYYEIHRYGCDILQGNNFISTKAYVQHGSMSVNQHCKSVAEASLRINKRLRLNGDNRELVRGALLHDYFLYDWHNREKKKGERLHGFAHANAAFTNAVNDYDISEKQKNIICSHMWPLNLTKLPRCREAWIVTFADKYCSLMETLKVHRGILKREPVRVKIRKS